MRLSIYERLVAMRGGGGYPEAQAVAACKLSVIFREGVRLRKGEGECGRLELMSSLEAAGRVNMRSGSCGEG